MSNTAFTINTATGVITFSAAPADGAVIRTGCEFYTQVRFGEEVDEALMLSHEDFASGGVVGDVPLIEVIEEVQDDEDFDFGGASSMSFGTSTEIVASHGRVITMRATAGSLTALLPSVDTLEPGGPHFYLINIGSNAFDILDKHNNTLFTLAVGASAVVLVYKHGAVQKYVGVIL